jgi:hypothetical protein
MASRLIFTLLTSVALGGSLAACSTAPASTSDTAAEAAAAPADTLPAASGTTTPPMLSNSCKPEPAQQYVGQKATADVVEAARVASGAKTARVLTPDMMVTMEYSGDRLNLHTNADNVVASVNCG